MKRPVLWAFLLFAALLVVWLRARPASSMEETPLVTPAPIAPQPVGKPAPPAPRRAAKIPSDPVPQRLKQVAPLLAARARLGAPGVNRGAALRAYRKELDLRVRAARANPAQVIEELRSRDPELRMQSIVVLTELGGERAARALANALEQESRRGLQLSLLHGLAQIGGVTAREALVRRYRKTAGDRHRYLVVRAIGDLAAVETLPLLVEALKTTGDTSLRAHAVGALVKVGGPRARQALEAARDAESNPAVAAAIRRALKKFNQSTSQTTDSQKR